MSYTEKDYNKQSAKIIACCVEVHKELLANFKLGLLINFNVALLKDVVSQRINGDLNSV